MECNFCHSQEAKIFLSQIFKGEIIKLDLCEACARKLEITDVQGVAVNELIHKIRQIQEEASKDAEIKCPECDLSLEDMKKRGQLGCPACYQAFTDDIAKILHDNQKGTVHYGKVPSRNRIAVDLLQREELEKRLAQAVKLEDFEAAAQFRDQLSQMTKC